MSLLSPGLEAFMAVAQNKTVHGAAKRMHLTQTAITQRLRALESRLRTTLFTRTRRGMQLTAEGEAVWRYCQAAQELAGQTLAQLKGDKGQTIRVAITGPTSIMRARIIPQCAHISQRFPRLLFQFVIKDSGDLLQELRTGQCQFAITPPQEIPAEMAHKLLHPEQYVLVGPAAWQKRSLRNILQQEKIIDYDAHDQITFHYLTQYHLLKETHPERHFVNHTDAIAHMIESGLGYGVLPVEFCQPWLKTRRLILLNEGKTCDYALALAWYPRHAPPAYFSALLEAIT